jgi:hypothetical protein
MTVTNWVSVRVPGFLVVSVVGVDQEDLNVRGRLRLDPTSSYYGSQLAALWVNDDTLIWTESGADEGYHRMPYLDSVGIGRPVGSFTDEVIMPGFARPGIGWWYWYPWFQSKHLWAVSVADPDEPELLSSLEIPGENIRNGFITGIVDGNKVYLSYRLSKLVPDPELDSDERAANPHYWWPEVWETAHELMVLDYSDPTEPVRHPSATLPADLIAVQRGGALLHTRSSIRWSTIDNPEKDPDQPTTLTLGSQVLTALAYDGIQAHRIAELHEPGWSGWQVGKNGQALGFRAKYETGTSDLGTWALTEDALWENQSRQELDYPLHQIHRFGDLWAGIGGNQLALWEQTVEPELPFLGQLELPCNLWLNWGSGDGNQAVGLWIPRGSHGWVHFPMP